MKGLRLTEIKSDGFRGRFSRYYLSEHTLVPQHNRRSFWLSGRIIHHMRSWREASSYFSTLAPHYDERDLVLEGER